jgi:DNA-binding response OmpR family regulator
MAIDAKKVLIVDDDANLLHLVALHMGMAGYDVITATDGSVGLKEAYNHIPSLVILDLMLPESNGWEVCRDLKKNSKTSSIPVLILSALSDDESRLWACEAGADDFMTKPFSPKELRIRAQSLVTKASMKDFFVPSPPIL